MIDPTTSSDGSGDSLVSGAALVVGAAASSETSGSDGAGSDSSPGAEVVGVGLLLSSRWRERGRLVSSALSSAPSEAVAVGWLVVGALVAVVRLAFALLEV